jgi:hypothetical protein
MIDYKVPKIQIDNIDLPEQEVMIKIEAGSSFNTWTLIANNDIAKIVENQVHNPCSLTITSYNINGSEQREIISKFDKLWLLRIDRSHPYMVTLIIADNRYSLKGKLLNCAYNVTINKNQIGKLENEINQPSDLKIDFDTFKRGRYALWSVKEDGSPYTMIEIVEKELNKMNIPIISSTEPENSYILENVEINNQEIYSGLNNLLKSARLTMSVTNSGDFYVFSVDEDRRFEGNKNILLDLQSKQSISKDVIYKGNNDRIRPNKINIKMNRFEECFLIYEKEDYSPGNGFFEDIEFRKEKKEVQQKIVNGKPLWNNQEKDNMRVIALQNVIQLPYTIELGGKKYNQGEFFPIQKFLWYLGLNDKTVCENWFADRLIYIIYTKFLKEQGQETREKLYKYANMVSSAIHSSYLQLFMIDPFVIPYINYFTNRDLVILDNYSRYQTLAPVYADYTIIPHLRNPKIAKRLENWDNSIVNWDIEKEDPYRVQPTVQFFSIVNQDLGVIKIMFPSTIFSPFQEILPFKLKIPPSRAMGQSINNLIALPSMLDKCVISEEYYLLIRASIAWKAKETGSPEKYNNDKKFHIFSFPENKDLPARGLEYTKFDPTLYAKFSMLRYTKTGEIDLQYDTFVNETITYSMAKSLRHMIKQQYRNYFKGRVLLAGYITMKLFSNINSVTHMFSPTKGTCTMYEANPYIPYTLEQVSDQILINKLHKQLLQSQLQ